MNARIIISIVTGFWLVGCGVEDRSNTRGQRIETESENKEVQTDSAEFVAQPAVLKAIQFHLADAGEGYVNCVVDRCLYNGNRGNMVVNCGLGRGCAIRFLTARQCDIRDYRVQQVCAYAYQYQMITNR